jgi:hypothetical protein
LVGEREASPTVERHDIAMTLPQIEVDEARQDMWTASDIEA